MTPNVNTLKQVQTLQLEIQSHAKSIGDFVKKLQKNLVLFYTSRSTSSKEFTSIDSKIISGAKRINVKLSVVNFCIDL